MVYIKGFLAQQLEGDNQMTTNKLQNQHDKNLGKKIRGQSIHENL